jgi:cbb3-type cytochrome oxidase subunit 3
MSDEIKLGKTRRGEVSMDIGLFRSVMTVVLFAAFIGIVLWAWSARRG